MDKEDFLRWQADPVTKEVLKYLSDFSRELAVNHTQLFQTGTRCTDDEFRRDSERYITLQQIINLEHEDIEGFYDDKTSMGQVSREAIGD